MRKGAAKHFDPHLLQLFIDNVDIFVKVKDSWKDS